MLETAAPAAPTASLPWPARALNATGGALRDLGLELVELDPVRIRLAAQEAARADDFGEYAPVVAGLEFFDVIALPRPTTPLEPSHAVGGDAHVSTLSIAVHDPSEREHAEAFCRELSERAYASALPVVVQLNKQHHVAPAVFRAMHRSALEELARVKERVDPDGVLGSRTLERLGF